MVYATIAECLDLKSLTYWYQAALKGNRPGQLYIKFRAETSIRTLFCHFDLGNLINEYKWRVHKPALARSVEDSAVGYAMLIAFTYFPKESGLWAFDQCDLSLLDWGNAIKEMYQNGHP